MTMNIARATAPACTKTVQEDVQRESEIFQPGLFPQHCISGRSAYERQRIGC